MNFCSQPIYWDNPVMKFCGEEKKKLIDEITNKKIGWELYVP